MSACSGGPPATFVESDVPLPVEMDVRFSAGILRDGGVLTNGNFLLSGSAEDLTKSVTETSARYIDGGWRETERTLKPDLAVLGFAKDDRTVRVEIDRRRIDPTQSTAVVRVTRDSVTGG